MKETKKHLEAEKILISRAQSCTDENMGLELTSEMSKEEIRATLTDARNKLRES